jgi:fructuronate reductase/mannitol 2-dehydrogenase
MNQTHGSALAVMPPLRNETLDHQAPVVAIPTYDRAALTPGVVHIGVGRFHRAHQALYFHELAERGVRDWGVIGVGLRSRAVKEALEPQDLLYTVVERGPRGDAARVVGALARFLHAPADPEAVLGALTDPRVRLVTVTVTANGYHLDASTGDLDTDAPEIVAELEHPERPTTFIGYVVEALDRRRRAGVAPFTVLSCDNVQQNGRTTRAVVLSHARLRDPGLAAWIEEQVRFPSSMVDRITPDTTEMDAEYIAGTFGIDDRSPVMTEAFRQWIVEDVFAHGRPPLEQVGVQFVADVRPYELMKKRLLNGSHTALAYLGCLAGHRTTDAALSDPPFRAFIGELMENEMTPLLPAVPGIDLDDYKRTLLERLGNTKIRDELQRLCRRGSTKVPSYLLAPIREARAAGTPHELLTLAVAGWLRYSRGVDLAGADIAVEDARTADLQALAIRGGVDPRPMLAERSIFGDLGADEGFARRLEQALRTLERRGPRGAIDAYLAAGAAPVLLKEAA